MQSPAHESYLVTEAMTAAPQKLHLMLVDGAIRFSQRALAQWRQGRDEEAGESLARAQEIVTEMICGLDADAQAELVGKLRAVYLFVFRTLSQAALEHSEERVNEALRVLAIQRETWQEVCNRFGSDTAAETPLTQAAQRAQQRPSAPVAMIDDATIEPGGFSLEA